MPSRVGQRCSEEILGLGLACEVIKLGKGGVVRVADVDVARAFLQLPINTA